MTKKSMQSQIKRHAESIRALQEEAAITMLGSYVQQMRSLEKLFAVFRKESPAIFETAGAHEKISELEMTLARVMALIAGKAA